jgi:hypothetical protein
MNDRAMILAGRLEVESAPGQGTVITLQFPATKSASALARNRMNPEMLMTESTRVLIIDDHPLFRRGVRQLLELEERLRRCGRGRRRSGGH